MTKAILSIFRLPRKLPALDAVTADRLSLMHFRIRHLGDMERDLNAWRRGYELRTGRAA